MIRIETYDQLMSCLNGLLECAQNRGWMDDPMDLATMEFVVAWFEENSSELEEWFNGLPVQEWIKED